MVWMKHDGRNTKANNLNEKRALRIKIEGADFYNLRLN